MNAQPEGQSREQASLGARRTVAIVGASDNPERTSHQAVERLAAKGHRVFPVNPKLKAGAYRDTPLQGLSVFASLADISEPVDTVSLYVSKDISSNLAGALTALKPRRVIFNPGAENPELAAKLSASGIQTLEACTLVLLSTNQF